MDLRAGRPNRSRGAESARWQNCANGGRAFVRFGTLNLLTERHERALKLFGSPLGLLTGVVGLTSRGGREAAIACTLLFAAPGTSCMRAGMHAVMSDGLAVPQKSGAHVRHAQEN